MFDIVKKLMMARQLSMEEGRLTMLNQNILMMPVAGLVTIQKELEKENRQNLIYLAARKTGAWWGEQMKGTFRTKKEDLVKWGMDVVSLAGYGKPVIINIDKENKRMIINLENSTMAEEYGNVGRCVDHMFRGYAAAISDVYFHDNMDAVEVMCKSKGDKVCQCVVKRRTEFDFSNKLVKEQLQGV
jgi:predicted hydrocarbon binding protein